MDKDHWDEASDLNLCFVVVVVAPFGLSSPPDFLPTRRQRNASITSLESPSARLLSRLLFQARIHLGGGQISTKFHLGTVRPIEIIRARNLENFFSLAHYDRQIVRTVFSRGKY